MPKPHAYTPASSPLPGTDSARGGCEAPHSHPPAGWSLREETRLVQHGGASLLVHVTDAVCLRCKEEGKGSWELHGPGGHTASASISTGQLPGASRVVHREIPGPPRNGPVPTSRVYSVIPECVRGRLLAEPWTRQPLPSEWIPVGQEPC